MYAMRRSPAPTMITIESNVKKRNFDEDNEDSDDDGRETPRTMYTYINTGKINCGNHCMCKVQAKSKEKRPAPAKEVITHKFKNGHCFLLCLLDSPRAGPTYLRQCLVPRQLRIDYHNYLLENDGQPKLLRDHWNVDSEIEMREHVFSELSDDDKQRQVEIAACNDTNEWSSKTHNGRCAAPELTAVVAAATRNRTVANDALMPPPVLVPRVPAKTVNSEKYWLVERVIGAVLQQGPPKKGVPRKRWFLIKWLGYSERHNSWEPTTKVDCPDAVKQFYLEFGRPTLQNPKILSPQGEKYELSQAAAKEFPETNSPENDFSDADDSERMGQPKEKAGKPIGIEKRPPGRPKGKKDSVPRNKVNPSRKVILENLDDDPETDNEE